LRGAAFRDEAISVASSGNTMTTDSIPVALLGYGYAGKTFHAPLIDSVPGLHLASVCSSDAAKIHADWPRVPVSASAGELFERPDTALVVITTPNETHFELARRALLAGKHVVVDKPMTVTLAQAQELARVAAGSARVLSAFHNRRWDADFLTVQHLIASGELGEIVHFESHIDRFRPEVRARWREQAVPGGGLWFDLGPHLVDQALQLFGVPDAVFADLQSQRAGAPAVDYFHVLLRYGRLRAVLHASALAAGGSPRFVIHGTAGSYVKHGADTQEEALKRGERPGVPGWGEDATPGTLWSAGESGVTTKVVPNLAGDYRDYYLALRDAIRGEAPNPVPPEQAIRSMAVIELALKSAEARRELTFDAERLAAT
jgi:predicted dehydrogenase